jgi:hypothetical protein
MSKVPKIGADHSVATEFLEFDTLGDTDGQNAE